MSSFEDLRDAYRSFVTDRDWAKFHDPKSLMLALVGEVGELAELYQWLPAEHAAELARSDPLKTRTAEELADVLIYLIGIADSVGVDLVEAATQKLSAAEARYPVEEHVGVAPDKAGPKAR